MESGANPERARRRECYLKYSSALLPQKVDKPLNF